MEGGFLRWGSIANSAVHGDHSRYVAATVDVVNELHLGVDVNRNQLDFAYIEATAEAIHVLVQVLLKVLEREQKLSHEYRRIDFFDLPDFVEL